MLNAKKKSKDVLRNPDDLERSIKVTGPAVWAVLGICIAVLVGMLIWGVLGSVTTNVSALGAVVDGRAVCFLSADDVAKVHEGDDADFGGQPMKVAEIGSVPLSTDEVSSELRSDYLADALLTGDWGYPVSFEGDSKEITQGIPQSVSITVERVAPITLNTKGRG